MVIPPMRILQSLLALWALIAVAGELRAEEGLAYLFKEKCSLCHPLGRILEKKDYTASDWQAVIDNMMAEQNCKEKVSPEEAEKIKKFLSKEGWQKEVSNE